MNKVSQQRLRCLQCSLESEQGPQFEDEFDNVINIVTATSAIGMEPNEHKTWCKCLRGSRFRPYINRNMASDKLAIKAAGERPVPPKEDAVMAELSTSHQPEPNATVADLMARVETLKAELKKVKKPQGVR